MQVKKFSAVGRIMCRQVSYVIMAQTLFNVSRQQLELVACTSTSATLAHSL